ncbi:MAG TPA: sulfatase [Sandaracinaceae bacterium LLY-WYZ-13_1]|nr:sulfatase [Sandaracinaceae bacterium LLY-WYZ-13_1]
MALLLLGCSSAAADPPSTPAPATSPARETGRARVRFDLATHFERAELRHGATLHVELGSPGGARHTAGGWLSNVGPDRAIDAVDAAITVSNRARLALPGDGRAAELAVRVRSFRPGPVRLYLDGEGVASERIEPGAWHVLRVALDAEQLAAGEHELLVRMDRGRAIEGVRRAYLALDWMRVGPPDHPPGQARPDAGPVDGVPSLRVPSGWSVAYPFEPPAGARLRGVARGPGRLEVWATREGRATRRLASVAPGEGARRFDVDLDGFAGDLARFELRAVGGAVRLFRPAVVTLDAAAPASLRRPRHVLVYLIDTLRADRLRAYAPDTRVRTPGFGRFARSASVFDRARAQENWTKPSVATLLSSLMPWEHTAFSDASAIPRSVRLLPEMLHDRGFATAGFVANGYVSNRFGFRRGWDTWRNYIRERRRTRGEVLAADALAWLDERPSEQPFFLYVHAIDPHVPYRAPDDFVALYDDTPYRGPVDFSRDAALLEHVKTGQIRLNARDRARLAALYDAEVSYQDTQLAALLAGLERRGLAEDTMVVVTADHGEELFDHGSVGHGHSLYEELIHVPLAIRVPGLDAPRRVEGAVGLVDVAPTILDALGEPIPDELSGRSLLPMLRGHGRTAPPVSVAGFMEHWRSVATGRYKLVARSRGRYALFDLADDPGEQHDLADERPMTVAYLRGLLGLRLAEARGSAHRARRRHRASEATIDDELEAQLRALGYVGASRPR